MISTRKKSMKKREPVVRRQAPAGRFTRTPLWLVLIIGGLLIGITGCSSRGEARTASSSDVHGGDYPIDVVATIGMVGDLVREVGGENVQVNQICGAGVDPHLHKPSRDDVRMILDADVVFYSGLMLEGKMGDTLVKVARSKPVYAVTEVIDESALLSPEEFEGHYDPHVWNDVSAWSKCLDAVERAMIEYDPDHADDYQKNAAAYRDKLAALHKYGQEAMATVPEQGRILVTSHDAFNYFGRAYGLTVHGVQGISTESEAGLHRINELVDLLVDQGVRALFVESSVSPKNIEALIEGARSRGHDVVKGGVLFSDAMGVEGTYEGTYIGMLDHNITVAAGALGGLVDPGGLNGSLETANGPEE